MKLRILHADDDILFSGIVSRILRQSGFDVFHASDGEQAWLLFNEMRFDFCLLDVVMPGLDGIPLGKRIRDKDQEVPICFLSGEDHHWLEMQLTGCLSGTEFFCKTFNIRKLSDALLHYFITPPIMNQDDSCRQI